jgi:hypothetical protein
MPTEDRSASAAMVRKIIRRVNMRTGLPPKQQSYAKTSNSTFIRFMNWRTATANRNIALPKNTSCGC